VSLALPVHEAPTALRSCLEELQRSFYQLLLSPILQILPALSGIASIADRNLDEPMFWQDSEEVTAIIGPVTHQLLSMTRLADHAASEDEFDILTVQEMVRLACLMLLSALKSRFGMNGLDMTPLSSKFSELLGPPLEEVPRPLRRLQLWALIVSGLLQPSEGRSRLVSCVFDTMLQMDIANGRDAVDSARQMLWSRALEEEQATLLAQEIDVLCLARQISTAPSSLHHR